MRQIQSNNKKAIMKEKSVTYAIVCFLSFALTISSLGAQIATGYQVATRSQFKTAAVSYTFDDNCSNQLPVALPLFNQSVITVTLHGNLAPSILITAPANVIIAATATDVDGTVSKVDFYKGNNLLGTVPSHHIPIL
jgi:hypothetical protein